jgi:hypothetical protein
MWPHRRRHAQARRIVERTFQISAKQAGQNISLARARRRRVTSCASTASYRMSGDSHRPYPRPHARAGGFRIDGGQLLKFQPESQETRLVVTAFARGMPALLPPAQRRAGDACHLNQRLTVSANCAPIRSAVAARRAEELISALGGQSESIFAPHWKSALELRDQHSAVTGSFWRNSSDLLEVERASAKTMLVKPALFTSASSANLASVPSVRSTVGRSPFSSSL